MSDFQQSDGKSPADEPKTGPGNKALQELTEIQMPQGYRDDSHEPGVLFSTEQSSRNAIAHRVNEVLATQNLKEYPVFEEVRAVFAELVARFEGSEAAQEQELTYEQFSDVLEGKMDLSDSLLITALERSLKVELGHL